MITNNSSSAIVLDRVETYDASTVNCYAFRRGTDMVEGHSLAVGNMVSGYPFQIQGNTFYNSECAYIAGMFSEGTDYHLFLQETLRKETNGFLGKKRIRRYNENAKRADWEEFNVQWMLYCVWCKVVGNADFRKILLDIPSDAVIIEDSTFQNSRTAAVWGAKNKIQRQLTTEYKRQLEADGLSKVAIKKACDEKRLGEWRKQGVFEGKNLMGKILMLCRDAAMRGTTPDINLELLRSKHIYLCGVQLCLDEIPTIGGIIVRVDKAIVLDHEEVYDPVKQNVWPFKHVDDIVEGVKLDLCNMTSCYPFEVDGVKWRSSEELYLAGEFSNNTAEHQSIQQELRAAKSPYAAKRFVKGKYRKQVREDFAEFRTQWMLWCVWQKCMGNADFRKKLLSIPDDVILVEEATTDTGGSGRIWGCSNRELVEARKAVAQSIREKRNDLNKKNLDFLINVETNAVRNVGLFVGQNNIGKILMICRHCLKRGEYPDIDLDLLRSKNIYILGKPLTFNEINATAKEEIALLNGNRIECFPKEEQPISIEDDNIAIDTTGQYLQVKRKPTKRIVEPINPDEEESQRLFLQYAFFFLFNADRILSDSRMFLAPIDFNCGLAYTGTSGMRKPTLGVYIEWWLSCQESIQRNKWNAPSLVYYIAGSPLSGANKCEIVNPAGESETVSIRNFLNLWTSFIEVNKRYTEAKQKYQSYTIKQVIELLKADYQPKEVFENFLLRLEMRLQEKDIARLSKRNSFLRKCIDELRQKFHKAMIELNLSAVTTFYEEYLRKVEETDIRLKQFSEAKRAYKERVRNADVHPRQKQAEFSRIKHERIEAKCALTRFVNEGITAIFGLEHIPLSAILEYQEQQHTR